MFEFIKILIRTGNFFSLALNTDRHSYSCYTVNRGNFAHRGNFAWNLKKVSGIPVSFLWAELLWLLRYFARQSLQIFILKRKVMFYIIVNFI